jgi:hypothetical protein
MDRKSDHASMRLEAGPRYLIRDRDGACGEVFIRRVRSRAFVIDRRRRARHGKTHVLNG